LGVMTKRRKRRREKKKKETENQKPVKIDTG
jgi:hypothetical protein